LQGRSRKRCNAGVKGGNDRLASGDAAVPFHAIDAGAAMTDGGPVSNAEPGRARGTAGEQSMGRGRPRAVGAGRSGCRSASCWSGWSSPGVLVWISASTYSSNEKRLLDLRVRDAGALIAEALPSIQTPLASAAALADATDGDVAKFKKFIGPSVAGKRFVSVSLWRLGPNQAGPIAVVGTPPVLGSSPSRAETFFANGAAHSALGVIGLLAPPQPRLGYAFTSPGLTGRYVVYGESALPASRRSRLQSTSSFADLHYALYLGESERPEDLLVTDLKNLPITAQHASTSIRFGNNRFTFVVSARRPLVGSFPQRLPWLIAIIGVLLSIGVALLTIRLIQRRSHAEQLAASLEEIADENRRLYSEQRSIAQTLQHALLPERLPKIRGVKTSARYEAGLEGVDIGGDWYDLIALDDRRLLLVVGDVSGRGVRAAATMASLRCAIHAYAAQNDPPATILTKLLEARERRRHRAARNDPIRADRCRGARADRHQRRAPAALLISNGTGTFIQSVVGVPTGVNTGATYTSTAVSTPRAATLFAFTDGLVERQGERIDAGLERLQQAATGNHCELDDLLGRLLHELRHDGDDDTAIAGLRWLD
jgi:Stage II sporulation protein E (SpoIIE)